MISPTIGRQVWYRPKSYEMNWQHTQPFAATVVHVWSDTCVNLAILDEHGASLTRASVTLAQDRGAQPGECEWMPYQIKTARAERNKEPIMHNVQSPRTDDAGIEAEILAKGLTAPRVTPEAVEANIGFEYYFTAAEATDRQISRNADTGPLRLLTFCVLVLRNGFTVTGESCCVCPENFDAEIGKKIARANAVNKVWPLMGYELKSLLAP